MNSLVMLSKKLMIVLAGILCLCIAWMTGTGDILNYIDFADPLNEMGFFMCCAMLGSGLLYVGFSK
tara:strand:+ start:2719 stop:2916 length:198 start_codon:yes stop_codon:yes gene_type:complete